ncbi:hypothetical protein DJ031_03695 [bacterium endosymbiont of Escarpia laminata]|nr:MAG: hypothetical protein DJ031_03695 [bacterium endosymbiont of Escarpia laminata]
MKSFLGQFSRSDFFAVLPLGFYIFMVVYSCAALEFIEPSNERTIIKVIQSLAIHIQQQPIFLIFILFACYMLGSIFRALLVYWAERSIPPFRANFPYPETLTEVIDTLNKHHDATKHDVSKMPSLKNGVPMHVFNYWKDVLCVNSIEGFEYYQTFETRVRLFTGIIWASWSGILGGIYIVLMEGDFSHKIGLPLFLLSLILLITFGSNLRRVRRQESRVLLFMYSAYLQK